MARLGRRQPNLAVRRYDRPPRYAALPRVVEVEITNTETETLTVTLQVSRGVEITATETETVTVTLEVSRGPYLHYTAIRPSYSNRHIRNQVTVTRDGGVAITATDTTSIEEYGPRSYSLSTLASTDADSTTAATRLLTRYAQPSVRYDGMTIAPQANEPDLFPQALGRQIGDRVTVIRTPQDVGEAIVKEVVIEGIGHQLTADGWTTTYSLSPAAWTE